MGKTIFRQSFYDAISRQDKEFLRSYVSEEISADPNFDRCVCEDCMSYLVSIGLDITVPYRKNLSECDVPSDRNLWDKRLFHGKVDDLRLNFAYNERIEELKEIGQKVYADEQVQSFESFYKASKGRRSTEEKTSFCAIIAVITIIAALIALVVYLIRK